MFIVQKEEMQDWIACRYSLVVSWNPETTVAKDIKKYCEFEFDDVSEISDWYLKCPWIEFSTDEADNYKWCILELIQYRVEYRRREYSESDYEFINLFL